MMMMIIMMMMKMMTTKMMMMIIIIIIGSVFLNCAEQGQIEKYKTHAYKTLKTADIQTIMLKHPTKQ